MDEGPGAEHLDGQQGRNQAGQEPEDQQEAADQFEEYDEDPRDLGGRNAHLAKTGLHPGNAYLVVLLPAVHNK